MNDLDDEELLNQFRLLQEAADRQTLDQLSQDDSDYEFNTSESDWTKRMILSHI